MKQLILLMIGLLAVLQYRLWQGDNNFSEYVLLQTQIEAQQQSNQKLVARNQILKEEIIDLLSGTEAIEERARNELGMVKEGETFYRVISTESRDQPFNP
ncbi:cell division protein FtsB [Shewanella sp. MF05960]|uniref:cell division protein FtsB n=1 Tax=Shewanella sp. MF05960 TaxID=3434874 RepID=UPI003D7B23F6